MGKLFRDRTCDGFAWGCFFLGVVIFLWVMTTSCSTNIPKIDVTMWAGDSAKAGVTRAQEHKTLACIDPQFDDYVCMSYSDVKRIWSTLLQCKNWGSTKMATQSEINQMIQQNRGVIDHVLETTNTPPGPQ